MPILEHIIGDETDFCDVIFLKSHKAAPCNLLINFAPFKFKPSYCLTASGNCMSIDTSNGYPLLVVQYRIQGHPTRTEHWSFVVMVNASDGETHELRGNFDTFTYVFEMEKQWAVSRPMALSGGCLVGYISPSVLPSLPEMLKEVDVVRHDRNFDCQTWIIIALRMLKEKGIAFKDMSEKKLRDELAAELEREETGHDVIYERIVAGGV